MTDPVRIGCFAAFWGDTPMAIHDILAGAEVDYLVADYLSEITMALLARSRAKDPDGGYVGDFVTTVGPLLGDLRSRGIRVVVNAGGLNPAGCARALADIARAQGVDVRIAAVEGDDLTGRTADLFGAGPVDSDAGPTDAVVGDVRPADAVTDGPGLVDAVTGRPVPDGLESVNAYLGARPIAAALAAGADVVITGRCVDAAVVIGPLLHEFGWADDDYEHLAAAALIGHIVECGPQATGGNVTDWAEVPGWDRMGYPVAECFADGTAVITKPAGTGGLVTPLTVGEQVLYEIGDPGAYLLPDVVCDWRDVTLTADGPDRVRVAGARGSAPTTSYKVTATRTEGFRVLTTAMFAGRDAAGKAERMAAALLARTERLTAARGLAGLDHTSIEVVGSGQLTTGAVDPGAAEVVVKIGAHSTARAGLEIFSTEFAALALVAQGMTGVFAGRPRVAPSIAVYHLLVDKAKVPVRIRIDGETFPVEIAPGAPESAVSTAALPESTPTDVPDERVSVPLGAIAVARSGDKGNLANIGVIARRPQFAPVLVEQLTAARIGAVFAHLEPAEVVRWAVPGLSAINVVLRDVLGGTGGTSTLRYDPQGKSYAAMLLRSPVTVPAAWVADGLLAS